MFMSCITTTFQALQINNMQKLETTTPEIHVKKDNN